METGFERWAKIQKKALKSPRVQLEKGLPYSAQWLVLIDNDN